MSEETASSTGRLDRFRLGLRRTREGFVGRLAGLFQSADRPPENWDEDLEAALIQADLGPAAAQQIVARVRQGARGGRLTWEDLRAVARDVMREMLAAGSSPPAAPAPGPRVILVVGVNGGGKTTTAGKLARRLARSGAAVLLCAADTFRAGAGEQLQQWARRVGVECVTHRSGADPAAVVHDAATAALARGSDALIVDTAGRLHTQDPLMRELEKIVRVVGRQIDGAPHEVLLVLDATTGQNGMNQAREFLSAARVNGLVLTKIDGTARGGVALRIVQEFGIPLRYVGVGEGPDDLVEFDADDYLDGLLPSAA
ncbi:MAG TPA: signal recognition particle-docking protein FtsY [Candidatus Polarisedimenticolia bacterium]|nr:signal recognition particle-docking protein FtsY [Candidatus Polarisedimenticolia bacterium]